jgi:hypothetical protein
MRYLTVEVDIENEKVAPRDPAKLPEKGRGLLTILQPLNSQGTAAAPHRMRVTAPLIRCKPGTAINPTPSELDAGL